MGKVDNRIKCHLPGLAEHLTPETHCFGPLSRKAL